MGTGKAPDPKRGKKSGLHASYLNVKCGQKEACYKAGELFGCEGHRTHAHQPCLFAMTDGALQCGYCTAGLEPVWRGFVPLWDRDWTLRYALIGAEYYPNVEAIAHRSQCVVSRAKNPISPLVIREEMCLTRALPDRSPWTEPVNMRDICLALWKCDELTRWYAAEDLKRSGPVVPVLTPTGDVKYKKDPLARLAEAERKAKEEDMAAAVAFGTFVDKALTPKLNGRHKPKG